MLPQIMPNCSSVPVILKRMTKNGNLGSTKSDCWFLEDIVLYRARNGPVYTNRRHYLSPNFIHVFSLSKFACQ